MAEHGASKVNTGPDLHPRRPAFRAPAGAIDCHAHIFGPFARYPLSPDAGYRPPESPLGQYLAMLDAVGIDRAVLVQGSPQGTDNRVIVDAIAAAPERFRGIAVVASTITDRELEDLAEGGIRGLRLSNATRPGLPPEEWLETMAARVRPLGWVVQVHVRRCDDLVALAPRIARLAVPVVIDHMGGVTGADAPDGPGFASLLALLRDCDHVWVKVAAFYHRSRQPAPYADLRERARQLAAARPERLVWGTNWPHPVQSSPAPNDGDLVDLVPDWFPDAQVQRRMLVDNPQALFGFPAVGLPPAG